MIKLFRDLRPSSCTNLDYYHSPQLTTSPSNKAAAYRCGKDATRYRKGVRRRSPAPQIVLRRCQCDRQTLRSAFPPNSAPTLLMDSLQENQGVKENLEDLVSWVVQLKENLTKASGGPEDAKRREQLRQFV